ncbi:MAG: cytochrome P450 [Marinobacter sp.]|nr:cytochrome P450 [Marinobacter sp.]
MTDALAENPAQTDLPPGAPLGTALALGGFLLGGALEQKIGDALVKRFGPLLTAKVPSLGTVVFVMDPAHIRSMVSAPSGSLVSGRGNAILGFLYGRTSMFLVDGAPHHRLRRLLVPPFRNKDTLAQYGQVMEEVANELLDEMPLGRPFALLPALRHGMLEIILRVVFGVEEEARLAPFRAAFTELLDISTAASTSVRFALRGIVSLKKWQRLQDTLRVSDGLIYSEIARRRNDPETETRDDILALLLRTRTEDGDLLSDVEIRDQLVTLLIAGHETTATTLAWAFERVLRTPSALARLQAELEAGGHEYADAVVSETLRLRPPIPVFSREVAGDFTLGGYKLPKGTMLVGNIGYIHQREDLYEGPQAFRPERFLGRRHELGVYAPFGGGLHSCIGNHFAALEVRVFLQVMLKRGQFVVPRKAAERIQRQTILNLPARGARVILRGRSPDHVYPGRADSKA